jgi:hypothetical protein
MSQVAEYLPSKLEVLGSKYRAPSQKAPKYILLPKKVRNFSS